MADVRWIKIVTDIFDDEKILLIESLPEADAIIVIWFKLLCLAGKQNNQGVFLLNNRIAYTDEMLATIFRRNIATVRLALSTFESFGMIEIIDGVITIPNWNKHQSLDALEKRREYQKELMRKRRAEQKALCEANSYTNSYTNSETNGYTNCDTNCDTNVSCLDKNRIDKNRIDKSIEEKEEKKKKSASRFSPPSLDDVKKYCRERNNNVDAEHFIDYYESNGWKVGKNSMKDWKAAVRNWEKNGYSNNKGGDFVDQYGRINFSASHFDENDPTVF